MALDEGWLSELPNDVIYRIISNQRISNKAAVQFSVLSKELHSALQRRPVLVFDWNKDGCARELEYVFSTFTRYKNENINLDTFKFKCLLKFSNAKESLIMDQCIQLATAKNLGLRNLNICMLDGCALSKHVFEAKSLVQLKLKRSRLQPADQSIITWPNLKRLRLWSVDMEKEVFENVIRGCPLIEILKFSFCCTSNFNFKVSNLDYLKKLDVYLGRDQTLELGATPKLECFTCFGGDLRFRVGLDKYEYHNLKTITMSGLNASFSGDLLINMAHQFPVLEELSIYCINLEKMNISSPSLKRINLGFIKGLQEASFDVPNVDLFTLYNNVVPKLSFSGNSGGWTSRITYRICNSSIDTSWYLKLKAFLQDAIKIDAACFSVVVHMYRNGTLYKSLRRPQVLDREKFLDLFKVDDDRNNYLFTIVFVQEYYRSGACAEQCTIMKKTMLREEENSTVKDSIEQPCDSLNSLVEVSGCFDSLNCKLSQFVNRWLFR